MDIYIKAFLKRLGLSRLKTVFKMRLFGQAMFVFSLVCLLLSVYSIDSVRAEYPWLDNQIRAYKYGKLAVKYSADNIKRSRYKAMAKALREGRDDYIFYSSVSPAIGGN